MATRPRECGLLCTFPPTHLSPYLRVRPLGRVTEVIFPSGSHVVGRSGTSFSGARAECAWGHEEPQNSARAAPIHQDRDGTAIAVSLTPSLPFSHHNLDITQDLENTRWKGQDHQSGPVHTHTHTHTYTHTHAHTLSYISTVPFTQTVKSCSGWWFIDTKKHPYPIQTELFMQGGKEIAMLYYSGMWVCVCVCVCSAAWHCKKKKSPVALLFKVWSGLLLSLWSLYIYISIFSRGSSNGSALQISFITGISGHFIGSEWRRGDVVRGTQTTPGGASDAVRSNQHT